MKHIKKVTMITGIAIFLSVFSLSLSFGALGTSNALHGASIEKKEVWDIKYDNISTIVVDDNYVKVLKEPVVNGEVITYSISLSTTNNYGQFQFDIKNDGNVDAKVTNIIVDGIRDYEKYISVSLTDLEIGDVIKAGTLKHNVKVITTYQDQFYDANMWPQSIDLENITIEIQFEKVI